MASADRVWRYALIAAVVVQFVVLYAPRAGGPGSGIPGMDKVVHFLIFAAVAALAVRVGVPPVWVVGLLAAQAVISETVQSLALAQRGGDGWDLLADVVGIAAGVALGRSWVPRGIGARGRDEMP